MTPERKTKKLSLFSAEAFSLIDHMVLGLEYVRSGLQPMPRYNSPPVTLSDWGEFLTDFSLLKWLCSLLPNHVLITAHQCIINSVRRKLINASWTLFRFILNSGSWDAPIQRTSAVHHCPGSNVSTADKNHHTQTQSAWCPSGPQTKPKKLGWLAGGRGELGLGTWRDTHSTSRKTLTKPYKWEGKSHPLQSLIYTWSLD